MRKGYLHSRRIKRRKDVAHERSVGKEGFTTDLCSGLFHSPRFILLEEADYFNAEDKQYTLVITKEGEFLIKKIFKELGPDLDPSQFWQIHWRTMAHVSKIDKADRSLTDGKY